MPNTIMLGTVYDVFNERYDTDKEFQAIFNRDIKLIKETGINTILPFPLGEWQGSTKTQKWDRSDYMIKGIEDNGFMFIPMLIKSQHNAYFPDFMQSKAKDIYQEMYHIPSQDHDEIKFNRQEVKTAIENYFKSIVERYGNSPSLIGYNIWNEPHFESMDDITVHAFQQWLKTKYGTIDNFNKVWASTYSDWSEISPLARNTWPSSMCYIDWHLFRYWYMGQLVKWSVDVLHKYDTKHFAYASPVLHQFTAKTTSLWYEDGKEIIPFTDAVAFSFYPDLHYNYDTNTPMG
jgi:beta-galactosidase